MNSIFRLTGKDIELIAKKKKKLCALSAAAAVLASVCAATAMSGWEPADSETVPDLSEYIYEEAVTSKSSNKSKTFNVKVTADGKTVTVSASGTAADALSAAGVEVGKNDLINVALTEPLNEHTDIVVQRVVYYKRTKLKKLNYSTKYREDDELPEGESKVIANGEKGEMIIKTIVKTVDGEEVASNVLSKEIKTKPVDRVIAKGTGKASAGTVQNTSSQDETKNRKTSDTSAPQKDDPTGSGSVSASAENKPQTVWNETSTAAAAVNEPEDTLSFEDAWNADNTMDETHTDDTDIDNDAGTINDTDTDTDEDSDTENDFDDWDFDDDDEFEELPEEPAVYDNGSLDDTDGFSDVPVLEPRASRDGCISMLVPDFDIKLDANGVPVSYSQTLHGKSCAYTADEGALMSTGLTVDQGYVAVNPNVIPYGSRLYIIADDGEVYGYAIAADTGATVGRDEILVDLFMWEYDDCVNWGAKNVTVYVIG